MQLNTKHKDDSEFNKSLYEGLARNIDLSYHFEWYSLFTRSELKVNKHSDELFRFISDVRDDVAKKAEQLSLTNLSYDDKRKAYVESYQSYVEYYSSKEGKPEDLVYKVDSLIRMIVLIQMTYTTFVNEDYLISLWFYEGYNSSLSKLNLYNGFDEQDIIEKIPKNPKQINAIRQKEKIIPLAKTIWLKNDVSHIISPSTMANIIYLLLSSDPISEYQKVKNHKESKAEKNDRSKKVRKFKSWISDDTVVPPRVYKRHKEDPNFILDSLEKKQLDIQIVEILRKYQSYCKKM